MMRILIFVTFLFLSFSANARPIISGISTNKINIDSNFTGEEILLFGAKGDVGDVVVVVRGPKKNYIINKKAEVLGVWLNRKRVEFNGVYSYYSFFATDESNLKNKILLKNLQIGQNNIALKTKKEQKEIDKIHFSYQLINKMSERELYMKNYDEIQFLDESLFKVMIGFPKNISRGEYLVEIYLIDDGNLTAFQSIPIYVNQVGFSAAVNDMAYYNPFLYAMIAIFLAVIAGFAANFIFNKLFK